MMNSSHCDSRTNSRPKLGFILALCLAFQSTVRSADNVLIWPGLAPGETSDARGTEQPSKPTDSAKITRIEKIRLPSMDVFPAAKPNGTAVVILPGGGFGKVVTDLEGSEMADILNPLGITAFVLRYRTSEAKADNELPYLRPLQDSERALRWVRHHAAKYGLQSDRVGVVAFSAGGHVGSVLHTGGETASYPAIDDIDKQNCRPSFSILVYPWNLVDKATGKLVPYITFREKLSPAFIVHTSDDASTSVGAALLYVGLKEKKVPAELHIYETGGHGYGTRPRPNSDIGTWPARAVEWLTRHQLADKP